VFATPHAQAKNQETSVPGLAGDPSQSYTTNPIAIKHSESIIKINEMAVFRFNQMRPESLEVSFLEYEFLSYKQFEKPKGLGEKAETSSKYVPVFTGKFSVKALPKGFSEYFMIFIQDQTFGVIECFGHSALLENKFKALESGQENNPEVCCKEFCSFLGTKTKNCKKI
jgi:hypothetical protein